MLGLTDVGYSGYGINKTNPHVGYAGPKVIFDQCFDPWQVAAVGATAAAATIIATAISLGWNAIISNPELVLELA